VVQERCFIPYNTPWHDGDCELAGPEPASGAGLTGPIFCFRSDGSGTFKARARSTDDDDKYVVRFEILDSQGKLLFRLPAETGPFGLPTLWTKDIPNPGIWYDWSIETGFPAQHFQKIYYFDAWAGC
jgi:hypothetical protein